MNQQDPYCFWLSTSMDGNIKPVSETVKLNFKPGHQISEMSLLQSLYHGVAKRTSTLVLAIGVAAFGFERGEDLYTTSL